MLITLYLFALQKYHDCSPKENIETEFMALFSEDIWMFWGLLRRKNRKINENFLTGVFFYANNINVTY